MKKEVLKKYNNIVSKFKKHCLGKDPKNEKALQELLNSVNLFKESCSIELIDFYHDTINGKYFMRVNDDYIDNVNEFITFFTMLRDLQQRINLMV